MKKLMALMLLVGLVSSGYMMNDQAKEAEIAPGDPNGFFKTV